MYFPIHGAVWLTNQIKRENTFKNYCNSSVINEFVIVGTVAIVS